MHVVVDSKLRIITEFAGALSIVLSLIFVGLELRHANNVAEADSVMQINNMFVDFLTASESDPDFLKARAEERGIDEWSVRTELRSTILLNILEATWKSFERGIMDEEQYFAYMFDGCWNLFPGGHTGSFTGSGEAGWAETKKSFNPNFIRAFESRCLFEMSRTNNPAQPTEE
jgi:hypothetical protein